MNQHYFVSDGGELFDTRANGWSSTPPLRENYRRHHREIKNLADFKASIRAGGFAWPGGYPLYFVCGDGESSLCFTCARDEFAAIVSDWQTFGSSWRVAGVDINYDDSDLYCAHCSARIESAYAEDARRLSDE